MFHLIFRSVSQSSYFAYIWILLTNWFIFYFIFLKLNDATDIIDILKLPRLQTVRTVAEVETPRPKKGLERAQKLRAGVVWEIDILS